MNLTITTDASFNKNHKVGTYAFWMSFDGGPFTWSGPLKGNITDSTEAEMMCICKALNVIAKDPVMSMKVKHIWINTDSLNAIWMFTGNVRKIAKYRLFQDHYKAVDKLYREIRSSIANIYIDFKHVRAHTGTDDKRSYVNSWADQRCKMEMSKLITSLENGNLAKNA